MMSNNKHNNIVLVTRTAVFIALLIILQAATAYLGNPLVTGSIVNLLLVVSVMLCGLRAGLSVALISPFMAKLVGIGPFWALIPFIALGNITLVLLWRLIGGSHMGNKKLRYIAAIAFAAVCKFLVLYLGIVKLAVPYILSLQGKQAAAVSAMFSFPQIITAAIGGLLAVIMLPMLQKAVNKQG